MPASFWQQERSGLWSLRSKRQLLPIADLNADGDAIDWLTLPRDIMPTLSLLVGDDGQATHTIKTDTTGRPIIAGTPPTVTTPPVFVGSYPVLLASLVNQTITTTTFSPSFDARQYGTIYVITAITAISGTTPSVTTSLEIQEPTSGAWWLLLNDSALTAVTAATTDGALAVHAKTFASQYVTGNQFRPTWPNARAAWTVSGTTPSITLSSYLWGF